MRARRRSCGGWRSSPRRLTILLGLTALACVALAAEAQLLRAVRVATVGSEPTPVWEAFERRLAELGYVEGRNLVRDRRWSRGVTERVPGLLAELLDQKPHVVVTSMLPPPPRVEAALCAPILAIGVSDTYGTCQVFPVARLSPAAAARAISVTHLRLARIAVPASTRVAVVTDSAQPFLVEYVRALEAAMPADASLGVVDLASGSDPLAVIARHGPDVMILAPTFGAPHARRQLAQYAARTRIPVIGSHLADGVVVAADYDWLDLGRRAADLVDQLLKGARPGDLRLDAPTKFDVIVDRRAASALGLTLPAPLLAEADRVLD